MKLLESGTLLDGFVIQACIHAGGMAHIYSVRYAQGAHDPGFPMVMKVPRMTAGDGAENIVGFEVEHQLLQILEGPHVPRFVAAGDLQHLPYLVMERIEGKTLDHWLSRPGKPKAALAVEEVVRLGSALAHAVHSLHLQHVCHHDLKPANVVIKPDGCAVLLDFGLSCHAHYPDLLAEEMRTAVGSAAWIAPEQIVGVRGDSRSDIFAVGVILYELITGELPFGIPMTRSGMRQRLWMDPKPIRQLRTDAPEWLQELVMRCLEPEAADRHASAALLAFDLCNPTSISITDRGRRTRGTGFWEHFKRWVKAAGKHYQPSPAPDQNIDQAPIIMVAIPNHEVSDATLYSLRRAVARSLGIRPGARLACVTVISPDSLSSTSIEKSEVAVHRKHLALLRQWAQPLDLQDHQTSYHVLEADDVAHALLQYAKGNHVNIIVMGAATHGLQLQRFVATVPIKVAMHASCTVILVRQELPFRQWLLG